MKCKNCGKENSKINNRKKYCSEECKKEYQKNYPKIYNYTCDFCGSEFKSKNKRKGKFNYCSFECSAQHKKEIKFIENKAICEWCGKDFIKKRAEQRFCSVNCTNKWQQTRIKEKSSNFNFKISWEDRKVICKNCQKEFYVIPSEINKRKFCSKECCHEWSMENVFLKNEFRKAASDRALFMLESGLFPKVESTPQRIIVTLLKEMEIEFEIEKIFGKFSMDIWLKNCNLCIEVMGDFWHCNPNKFSIIKYFIQKDRIKKDKAKNTYITKKLNIPILYLWEKDIYEDLTKCEKLINLFISSKGIIRNYESFNYLLNESELILKDEIIKSYREYPIEELRKIINLKNMHTNND